MLLLGHVLCVTLLARGATPGRTGYIRHSRSALLALPAQTEPTAPRRSALRAWPMTMMAANDLEKSLSVNELKRLLGERGVDFRGGRAGCRGMLDRPSAQSTNRAQPGLTGHLSALRLHREEGPRGTPAGICQGWKVWADGPAGDAERIRESRGLALLAR